MIRLMLVDDQTIYREGFLKVIDDCAEMEVVGCFSDVDEAAECFTANPVDVVLMDMQEHHDTRVHPVSHFLSRHSTARVVMLTAGTGAQDVLAAIKAGATGYILKDESVPRLLEMIATTADGEMVLSGKVASLCLEELRRLLADGNDSPTQSSVDDKGGRSGYPAMDVPQDPEDPTGSILTQREREILSLLPEGLSNQQIATRLFISEKTVKKHLNNVFAKLHVTNRSQAAVYAIRSNLASSLFDEPTGR